MANLVQEALEIISDDGNGNPVAYTNADLGISAGVMRVITGRPGLDGSKTVTGPYSPFPQVWGERVLADSFEPSITRDINFKRAGAVGSVSTFQAVFQNTAALWKTLADNGVYLNRCTIRYYRATSSDGNTWAFEQRWEGVIDEQPFSELKLTARCVDNSKDIFTSIPKQNTDAATFPDAAKDSLDKPFPIVFGRVAYSPLLNVITSGEKIVLSRWNGADYKICPATAYNDSTKVVSLKTPGVAFQVNDASLVGLFISPIAGMSEQSRKIVSNAATSGEVTNITIEEAFDVSPAFVAWAIDQPSPDVAYFEVSRYSATLIAAGKTIKEMVEGPTGAPALYTYDSVAKAFTDISEVKLISSLSNIKSTGFPGYHVIAKSQDTRGNLDAYVPIYPSQVTLEALDNIAFSGPAGLGQAKPLFYDRDRSVPYAFNPTAESSSFHLYAYFPEDALLKTFDELYLLVDFDHRMTSGSFGVLLEITVFGRDVFGRPTDPIVPDYNLHSGVLSSQVFVFMLPGVYYNTESTEAAFFTHKAALNIASLVDSLKKSIAYPVLGVAFQVFSPSGYLFYELNIREIGIVGKRSINFASEPTYGTLKGEVYGSTFGARKTSTDMIENPANVLEALIRKYDYDYPAWQAGKAYVVGNKVRTIADNNHFYVCTVAGTSHATTEPTFPTTSGDTVADNTVTWKELGAFKINTSSFDTLASQRIDWFLGRTLIEKKDSIEYYRQLAAQCWFLITQNASGEVEVNSWLENTTPLVAFSSSNILQGTLQGEMQLTDMADVFNCGVVHYDWNEATKSYNKQLFIDHIDEPEFPSETELVSEGTSLGTFSIVYAPLGSFGDYFSVTTTDPHGLTTGDFVSMNGNTHGYDFASRKVSVTSATQFYCQGHLVATSPSTTGTLRYLADARVKWKTFCGGIENYAEAKRIWDRFRASYVVTKVIQKFPDELSNCPWFIDPLAEDPSGNRIWPDLDVGDHHPAAFHLYNMSIWTAWQKKVTPPFEVDDNATMSALKEGSPVSFNDAKLTAGVTLQGWICEKSQIGRGRFRIRVILAPEQVEECETLTDTAGAADTITDTAGAADTITDQSC